MPTSEKIVGREKYWGELDPNQKVERMRGEVKSLQYRIRSLEEIIHQLQRHYHEANGDVVAPIGRFGYLTEAYAPSNPEEVWF